MTVKRDHLLPGNATALERAIAGTTARIDDIPVPIDAVLDPMRCPAPLLPWLAWQRRVKEWNSAWPEATQRAVIAGNYDVLAHAGTRAGVVNALRAQGFADVQHECWFEYGGSPYRFRLTVPSIDGAEWTDADDQSLIRTALAAKAARSRLESVNIRRGLSGGAFVEGVLFIDETIDLGLDETDEIDMDDTSHLAGALRLIETIEMGLPT